MNVVLQPKLTQIVKNQVKSGRYESADDVLSAALVRLMQDEKESGFAPGELAKLVEAGEADIAPGDVVSIAQVRQYFRRVRAPNG